MSSEEFTSWCPVVVRCARKTSYTSLLLLRMLNVCELFVDRCPVKFLKGGCASMCSAIIVVACAAPKVGKASISHDDHCGVLPHIFYRDEKGPASAIFFTNFQSDFSSSRYQVLFLPVGWGCENEKPAFIENRSHGLLLAVCSDR